jgi:hypothetical protein
MSEECQPRAIINFGGMAVLLPVDDAIAAFKLLCNGEAVTYSWEKKGYKRVTSEAGESPALRMFSITDYASLALNSVPE